MKRKNPYAGRHARTQAALRQPSQQIDDPMPKGSEPHYGEVQDRHLRGMGNPFSEAHGQVRKRQQ
jgi:hypothetical protein